MARSSSRTWVKVPRRMRRRVISGLKVPISSGKKRSTWFSQLALGGEVQAESPGLVGVVARVLGEPQNARNKRSRTRLRTVAELYPEVVDPALDVDNELSCSAIEALDRQEAFVNAVLAHHALALLARLFRYGQVSYHGGFVDVATSRSVPLAVEPSLWRRVRKRLVNGRNGDSVELGK